MSFADTTPIASPPPQSGKVGIIYPAPVPPAAGGGAGGAAPVTTPHPYRIVNDATDRLAIPLAELVQGLMVYEKATGTSYVYNNPAATTNAVADWQIHVAPVTNVSAFQVLTFEPDLSGALTGNLAWTDDRDAMETVDDLTGLTDRTGFGINKTHLIPGKLVYVKSEKAFYECLVDGVTNTPPDTGTMADWKRLTPQITLTPPASATAAGNPGDVVADAGHIYVCIAANTWVRGALGTF